MVFFMKDTSADDLRAIIEFMYKGSVNVAQTQLASFIKTAELLQIRGLSGDDDKVRFNTSYLFVYLFNIYMLSFTMKMLTCVLWRGKICVCIVVVELFQCKCYMNSHQIRLTAFVS